MTTTLIPEGFSTSRSTLLHDLIRIQTGGPVIVIAASSEITGDNVRHTVCKPDKDAQ